MQETLLSFGMGAGVEVRCAAVFLHRVCVEKGREPHSNIETMLPV